MAERESKRVELAPGLFLLPGRRGGRYPHCNSLFIDAGEKAIIDPGSDRREIRALAEQGLSRALLTHFHSDHVRDLREIPGVRVMVHQIEKAAVESWEGMKQLVWFPEEKPDPTWISRKDAEVGGWGWPVEAAFADGDEIRIGSITAVCVHTPGHTPGHTSFWFPDRKLLFLADIDLTPFGPWYGNSGSNLEDFLRSINRVKALRPAITVTGHEAGVIEGGLGPCLDEYAQVIHRRHQRILGYLGLPHTPEEITREAFIYGEYFTADPTLRDPEWRMVRHHLTLGLHRGEIVAEEGTYRRTGKI